MLAAHVAGWIGSTAFALSSFPQALDALRHGHTHGLARWTLIFWIVGEVGSFWYTSVLFPTAWATLANYVANMVGLIIVARYTLRPRKG